MAALQGSICFCSVVPKFKSVESPKRKIRQETQQTSCAAKNRMSFPLAITSLIVRSKSNRSVHDLRISDSQVPKRRRVKASLLEFVRSVSLYYAY